MIISEIKDQVGYISLDNSSRLNALSSQRYDELIACLNEYETKKIRAVVLKATPNKNNVWSAQYRDE